ncbi:sodium-dependent transporter [Halonotius aquaticus]|uniref:Transporter n=1 Tax=Halonotius aquaticus TaxID=2216978 RepID=A0A3A6Q959_9EURY|nr:sodium-dependent transporter [Halonotius aquaticus]RJX43594.1 sodium-dependent transporter [Halonotius aquaticus]
MDERATWATRIGFILAAAGSAVGLGNIWRFPFLTGESGGAAFLVVYLLLVVGVGVPVLLVEFVIGRRSNRNPIGAFERLGHPGWKAAGAVGAIAAFIIFSYYSVVGGWVIQYVVASFTGGYGADAEAFFLSTASGTNAIAYHGLFMATVAGIVALGIRNGLEKAATVMVPTVVVLLVGLAGYGATLDGAGAAYSYYLAPDLSTIVGDAVSILPAAAGQAFYTLSLGMGIMITYASYIGEDRNLLQDAGVIVVLDTAIALLAGLVVFPFLFTQGIEPGEGGAGSIFISLAGAFQQLPGGELLGGVFFLMLLVAALTSAFSIFEVVVSYITDTFDVNRVPTALGMAAVLFVVGIPTALDLTYLDAYDLFANNILLILSGLLLSIFIGWVYAGEAVEELGKGRASDGRIEAIWLTTLRYVVPIVLAITLALSVRDYIGFLQESFL